MENNYKEPIKYKWIWVVIGIIVLIGVPWYLPTGSIYPLIFGFPYWAFISVVSTIVLAGFLTYVVNNYWDMEDIVEEIEEERGNSK